MRIIPGIVTGEASLVRHRHWLGISQARHHHRLGIIVVKIASPLFPKETADHPTPKLFPSLSQNQLPQSKPKSASPAVLPISKRT